MDHTTLGLTRIAPGDSPWADGGAFFGRNIDIINHYLRTIAAHRHDEHVALADPAVPLTAVPAAIGGELPADTEFFIGYTLVDADGGETALSAVTIAATPAAGAQPSPFTGTPDYAAGSLPAGTYYYALTATDGAGGETPPSDPVVIVLEPGHANGEVTLEGLTAATGAAPGWRLYRSVNGGDYGFLAAGATDTFVDDCSNCADPQLPPPDDTANATSSTAKITVTLPTPLPAGAVAARIYAALDGSFPNPSLVAEVAAADAATPVDITTLLLEDGQPPTVSTTLPGAPKITLADLADEVTAELGGGAGATIETFTVSHTVGEVTTSADDGGALTIMPDYNVESPPPAWASFALHDNLVGIAGLPSGGGLFQVVATLVGHLDVTTTVAVGDIPHFTLEAQIFVEESAGSVGQAAPARFVDAELVPLEVGVNRKLYFERTIVATFRSATADDIKVRMAALDRDYNTGLLPDSGSGGSPVLGIQEAHVIITRLA